MNHRVRACIAGRSRPPLRPISRLTVDAARPSVTAIERIEPPATTPREISSRSDNVSAVAVKEPRDLADLLVSRPE